MFRGGGKTQFAYLILHEGKVFLANEAHFAFDDRKRLVGSFFRSRFFLCFRKRKLKKIASDSSTATVVKEKKAQKKCEFFRNYIKNRLKFFRAGARNTLKIFAASENLAETLNLLILLI